MLDRASTFADPEIVRFLQTKTVPVAIDQAYQRRQKDSEGDFYRRIVSQSPRKNFGNQTTQGLYMAAADGTFLGFTNNRDPDRVKQMLQSSVDQWDAAAATPIRNATVDSRWNPSPPDGGFVVRVQARILDGYDQPETQHQQIFQTALSRDNLWITQGEHNELVAGRMPAVLAERIARYHLVDNTRGEPPMWKKNEVVVSEIEIDDGLLIGQIGLKTQSGDRSYSASLRGHVEAQNGTVSKFDVVALGTFAGEGRYTRGAPKKPFPLAISFTLADGTDIADSVPPQASRGWVDGYLRPQ